jgi:hypothetical protein
MLESEMKLSNTQKKELEQFNALAKTMGFPVNNLVAYAEQYDEPRKYKKLGAKVDANSNIHLDIEKNKQ